MNDTGGLWRWLNTPPEPRGRYVLFTALFTFVLMTLSLPFWTGRGTAAVAIAGGLSGFLGSVGAKLWMERKNKG